MVETPETIGEERLPPGAWQRFVFAGGAEAASVTYRTSMGERGQLEGILTRDAARSTPAWLVFCDAAGCERMELAWEALAEGRLGFRVQIDGRLHADFTLEFEGDP